MLADMFFNMVEYIYLYIGVTPFYIFAAIAAAISLLGGCIFTDSPKEGPKRFWGIRGQGPVMLAGIINGALLYVLSAFAFINRVVDSNIWIVWFVVLLGSVVSLVVGLFRGFATVFLIPWLIANSFGWEIKRTMVVGFLILFLGLFLVECEFGLGYLAIFVGSFILLCGVSLSIKFLGGIIYGLFNPTKTVDDSLRLLKTDFYSKCKENGVHSCEKERDIQKATLIAQQLNIQFTDICALYAEAKSLQEEMDQKAKEAELAEMLKKETEHYRQLTRYSHHSGREKRVAILYDCWQRAKNSSDKIFSDTVALIGATQEREKDWAIQGGIANGIAGPAAGLAIAVDTQLENARIRAQNQANREAYEPLVQSMFHSSREHGIRADQYEKEYNAAKLKLVAKESAEDCLKRLRFHDIKVNVSETGTCKVTVRVSLNEPFYIFDDVKAVIDGTVSADIYDGENQIGSALLVLPCYGVGLDRSYVEGLCLSCGAIGKEYTVKFAATNLWAMEM